MLADDIVLCRSRRDNVERKLEKWRRAMEQRGLKISRMKIQYLGCNEHQDAEIHLQGETIKGVHSHTWDRRWRLMEYSTGCGSHPQSAGFRAGVITGRECM